MHTVKNAVRDYLARIAKRSDYFALRQVMADAIGVNSPTLQRWLKDNPVPQGLVWIKVAYYLELRGYEIQELKSLDVVIYQLGKHLADDKLTVEDVLTATQMDKSSRVYELFRNGQTPLPERMLKIKNLNSSHTVRITRDHNSSMQKGISVAVPTPASPVVLARKPEQPNADETMFKKLNSVLTILDSATGMIHSDLESLLSDDFTPEQRAAFRDHVDPDKFFRLTNRVSRTVSLLMNLGSEKAREIASQKR